MAKKIFILGTNSLTSSEDSTLRFGNDNEIVIPFPEGLTQLSNLASEFTEKGRIAKILLDYFSTFKIQKLLSEEGVRQKNGSILRFERGFRDIELDSSLGKLPSFDARRIQVAKGLNDMNRGRIPVIIVSKNATFRMLAQSIGLKAQDFKDDIFPSPEEQYEGRVECQTTQEKIDMFLDKETKGFLLPRDIISCKNIEWYPNLFLEIYPSDAKNSSHKEPILARYNGEMIVPLEFEHFHPYGITARTPAQKMALEALLQPCDVAPLVILKGAPGTGKTFLAMAVALQQTLLQEKCYKQILLSTPLETVREETLGFLPGDLENKYNPHLGGVMDNLTDLISFREANSKTNTKKEINGKKKIQDYIDRGIIVLQMIGYLRGRSIVNSIYVIDETQNIEPSAIKSIVSRSGEGSKFIFLGDPSQIDNPNLNTKYNGLVYLSEKMKGNPVCWQMTFKKEESVRSELAFLASKIL